MIFKFFKFCSFFLIVSLFALGTITLSDVFIHANALRFQVLTVIIALIFVAMGLLSLFLYRNFSKLHQISTKVYAIREPLTKLMLFFGILALFMTFAVSMLAFALLQRMISGTALLG